MERQRNQHPGAEFDHFAYSTTKIAPGGKMPAADKQAPVTIQELLVSSLAQTDALAKLLIEKGIIMQPEFSPSSWRRLHRSGQRISAC
jgi:hypothetical protein